MTGGAATVIAIGSGAWYYHMFGRPAHAMTPAEEGCALF
jgi:ubiquinol-cytochrome c reductase cytochrome c1 subunit